MSLTKRDIANLAEAVSRAVTDTLTPSIDKAQRSGSIPCSNHMSPWTEYELANLRYNFRVFIIEQARLHKRTNLSISHKLRSILSEPF